jgi:hypothetical protein
VSVGLHTIEKEEKSYRLAIANQNASLIRLCKGCKSRAGTYVPCKAVEVGDERPSFTHLSQRSYVRSKLGGNRMEGETWVWLIGTED